VFIFTRLGGWTSVEEDVEVNALRAYVWLQSVHGISHRMRHVGLPTRSTRQRNAKSHVADTDAESGYILINHHG
jgi:hypothetical protein